MRIPVINAPKGMKVDCWSIIGPHSPAISGFVSPEAAHAWGTEWGVCPHSIIAPVCTVAHATAALARFEAEMDKHDAEDGDEDDEPDPPFC